MFDISWTEFLLIGIVALIVIGPKELPAVMRSLGQWTRKIRSLAADFQNQFHEAMREAEMADLKKQVDDMAHPTSSNTIRSRTCAPTSRPSARTWTRALRARIRQRTKTRLRQADSAATTPPAEALPIPQAAAELRDKEVAGADVGPVAPEAAGRIRALRRRRQAAMRSDDEEKEIEATKAPLMDHLIELRSRLIKALAAFALAAIVCFFFARNIYNVLTWPYIWVAGPENSKFIYTGLLEYFVVQLKLALFGAAFISFPVMATQIYMFVAPGLYRNERQAFLPYLIATPIFFLLGSMVVYFVVWPMLARFSLSMQQLGGPGQATIELLPKVEDYLSLMMKLILAFGIAFQLPGHSDAARPGRHRHLRSAAARSAATSSSSPLSSPPCSPRRTC